MIDNCRNIGSDKVFTLAKADNQRIILFGADDFIRLVFAHKHQTIGALDELQHLFDGFFEISVILVSHQMSHNLAVRFGHELMSLSNQLFLQAEIVFNNTIMDNDKLAAAVRMGMRVAIRRTAMCRPACVTDTYIAHRHIACQLLTQCIQTAYTFFYTDFVVFINSNAGRIITTILQLAHTVKQKGGCFVITDITYNSAHK